jgi:peptidoglycan/xylan/chitin deacetylase (PgdA/CDA1 family)
VTIDDGYADFMRAGLDVFAKYDCPVTVFLVSGFLDGHVWLWWDQVEFACLTSTRRHADVGPAARRVTLESADQRRRTARELAESLKPLPDARRRQAVSDIASALDVTLPARAPAAWAPMTWDDARGATARGASFGAHTVTHPVLSRTDDAASASEITESWARVKTEVKDAVPVFCYPNGTAADFGAREIVTLESRGFETAVSTIPGYAGVPLNDWRWRLPRFSWPANDAAFFQLVTGVERLKMKLRGESPA